MSTERVPAGYSKKKMTFFIGIALLMYFRRDNYGTVIKFKTKFCIKMTGTSRAITQQTLPSCLDLRIYCPLHAPVMKTEMTCQP